MAVLVLITLLIVILAAYKYRSSLMEKIVAAEEKGKADPVAHYTGLGLVFGMVFGLTMFDDTSAGLAIGMSIGIAIGASIGAGVKRKMDGGSTEE